MIYDLNGWDGLLGLAGFIEDHLNPNNLQLPYTFRIVGKDVDLPLDRDGYVNIDIVVLG